MHKWRCGHAYREVLPCIRGGVAMQEVEVRNLSIPVECRQQLFRIDLLWIFDDGCFVERFPTSKPKQWVNPTANVCKRVIQTQ